MSDESQPPPLRLKPRASAAPAQETPAAVPPAPPSESAPSPAAGEGEAPRLRLKPKLSGEAAVSAAPAAAPASAPAPAEDTAPPPTPSTPAEPVAPAPAPAPVADPEPSAPRPRLKPRLSSEPSAEPPVSSPPAAAGVPLGDEAVAPPPSTPQETSPAADTGRFKLKPKAPAPAPADAGPAAAEAAPIEPPPLTVPSPEKTAEASAEPAPVPAPKPPVPPRGTVDSTEEVAALTASLRPEEKPAFRIGLVVAGGLALLLLGGGGYFAYRTFLASPSEPAVSAPKPAPAPSTAVNGLVKQAEQKAKEIASVPGELIDKAQDSLAARRNHEQQRVDAAVEGKDYNGERALNARTPGQITERLGRAEPEVVHLDLGSASTPPSAPAEALTVADAAVEPSDAFKAFVTSARISGVFQGNPPRALINGRTVRPGDLLENKLGITFERVDADRKLVFFKDATGAIVAKKY